MNGLVKAAALAIPAAGIAIVSVMLWSHRPWRVAVEVNGRVLSSHELDFRAQTMMREDFRQNPKAVATEDEAKVLARCRRDAAKAWIVKEIMLAEAMARGYEVGVEDERDSLRRVAARLKGRNMTPDEFFREGPLPEAVKRSDFREGVLIDKFVARELRDKISIPPEEIERRVGELKRLALADALPGGGGKINPDRRTAVNMLRAERFAADFRTLFRSLFVRTTVKCADYPELEKLDVISPPEVATKIPSALNAPAPQRPGPWRNGAAK